MSSFDPIPPIRIDDPNVILINPIAQRFDANESPAAPVGTGQKILITTPDSTPTDPVVLNVTDNASDGSVDIAIGTIAADVYITGDPLASNAARLVVGLGANSAGQILSNAGSTFQVADYYKGQVIVNYTGAIPVPGVKVDLNSPTVERITAADVVNGQLPNNGLNQSTIGENAPKSTVVDNPNSPNLPDFYINTGAANDQILGSGANDFIRAGAGDDIINGGDGNDIIRAGTGNDEVTLGAGTDIYYLTFDQFLTPEGASANTQDTITDFNAAEDSIQLAAELASKVTYVGLGTNSVTFTYNGSTPPSTLTIVSNGDAINTIQFV